LSKTIVEFVIFTSANVLALAVGVAFSWTSPVLPKLNGSVDPDNNPLGRPITSSEESLITSLLSLGSLIGLVPAGMAADKLGRKKTLLILACPVVLSFLMMAFAQSVYLFFIARFLMGLGAGSVFIILPMYLGEIAEDHNRGIMSCLMGNFNSSGLVFAFTIGPYLSVQWFCLVCLIPLLIFIPIFWIWNPETPQYFASIGDQKELEKSLLKLRSKSIDGIQKEALEISRMVQELSKNKGGVRELFVTQSSRKRSRYNPQSGISPAVRRNQRRHFLHADDF
jgi:MFS family permease